MAELTVRIKRFNPDVGDTEPHYQDFTFDAPEGATLLDCLNYIKWNLDDTLAYRMSCRSAICGSCAMRVNNGADLACVTQATDKLDATGTVTIEPLGNMPVIKDLVTDFKDFWAKMESVKPYLANETPPETGEHRMTPESFNDIVDATTCIMCGACYSECTSYEVDRNFLGPAALAKAQRFVFDTRDEERQERMEELSEYGGIWDCAHCFYCVQACPKPVEPLYRIIELRQEAHRRGLTENNGSRHARAFVESVEESGWLDEAKLPMKSVGSLPETLELIPVGIRMGLKNKFRPNPLTLLPGRHHEEIPQMGEVTKIIQKATEETSDDD